LFPGDLVSGPPDLGVSSGNVALQLPDVLRALLRLGYERLQLVPLRLKLPLYVPCPRLEITNFTLDRGLRRVELAVGLETRLNRFLERSTARLTRVMRLPRTLESCICVRQGLYDRAYKLVPDV
jgi:hypothetical protein